LSECIVFPYTTYFAQCDHYRTWSYRTLLLLDFCGSTSPDYWQVSGVIRTAVANTHLTDGTEVRIGEQVVACVAEANLDVRFLVWGLSPKFADFLFVMQKTIFGTDPRAAVYNRTPVENAGILGVGRNG
jgi:hypothetical protein